MGTADLFRAIGEENRLRILNLLANRGDICVCNLVRILGAPQGRISRHLSALRHAGLVQQRREGTWILYSLAKPESPIESSLMRLMKRDFPKDPTLVADLEAHDRLSNQGKLTVTSLQEVSK